MMRSSDCSNHCFPVLQYPLPHTNCTPFYHHTFHLHIRYTPRYSLKNWWSPKASASNRSTDPRFLMQTMHNPDIAPNKWTNWHIALFPYSLQSEPMNNILPSLPRVLILWHNTQLTILLILLISFSYVVMGINRHLSMIITLIALCMCRLP